VKAQRRTSQALGRAEAGHVVADLDEDERALPALTRALPHLGAHGWVSFDTARSVDRGIHPAQPRSVRVEPEDRT
jgi:hypothetical protein